MMKHLLPVVAAFAISVSACASARLPVVEQVKAPLATPAIYYWLPRTDLVVGFLVTKTSIGEAKCGGEAALLADLGLEAPKSAASTIEISDLQVQPFARRDPDAVFAIHQEGGAASALKSDLVLTEDGLVTSAEFEAENKAPAMAASVISMATDVLSGLIGFASGGGKSALWGGTALPAAGAADYCKAVKERIDATRLVRLTLLSTAAPSTEALQLALDDLSKTETSLLRNFTGSVKKELAQVKCEVILPPSAPSSLRLIWYGKATGVKPATTNGVSCIIPNTVAASAADTTESDIELQLTLEDDGLGNGDYSKDHSRSHGMFYRLPRIAEAKLIDGATTASATRLAIAQYGALARLAGGTDLQFGKIGLGIAFGSTGNLRSIKLQGDPVDIKPVTDAIGTGSKDIFDALAKRQEAQSAAKAEAAKENDELSVLEKRRKKLEELQKIIDLEQKLGLPATKPTP